MVAYLALHAGLAIVMSKSSLLATGQAVLAVLVGCWIALRSREVADVLCICGYIAGSDVLWRMTQSAMFYEGGKYAIAGILIVWSLRFPAPRFNWAAALFILLLVPSVVLTITRVSNWPVLRMLLSSNLSGPFALAVCGIAFHQRGVRIGDLRRLFVTMLGPLVGVAAICSFSTVALPEDYEFGSESNFETSGGFGPNQVSSMLGWGCLIAFLWAQSGNRDRRLRWLGFLLIGYFLAQSSLTFSRTGVWIGVGTILTAAALLVRRARNLIPVSAGVTVLFLVGYFAVFPLLDEFTGGKLRERFTEEGFSRREDIAAGDLEIARRYPVLGVGLGLGREARMAELGVGGPPHTEFTRLLAEHGSLGLLAVVLMIGMGLIAFQGARDPIQKAVVASTLMFACLFMSGTGMRLAAPSFAFGILTAVPAPVRGHSVGRSPYSPRRRASSSMRRPIRSIL